MFNVNEYFEGRVKSIAFEHESGKATLGVMAPGEYEFGTNCIEIMQVVSGKMSVLLPDASGWSEFKTGDRFTVEANRKFKLQIKENCSYLCLYQ